MATLEERQQRLLHALAGAGPAKRHRKGGGVLADREAMAGLIAADLIAVGADGVPRLTGAGRAHVARRKAGGGALDPFRAQHLDAATALVDGPAGPDRVAVDQGESPLAWLARRRGRDGRPLIEPHQLQAGERLRAEFTFAQMTPRMTADWNGTGSGRGNPGAVLPAEAALAGRQRLRRALDAAGPEFAGLLLDVCCFLKRLEEIEHERRWPARSAKLVLQLGLDRLARHYGLGRAAQGRDRAPLGVWLAPAGEDDGVEETTSDA